MTEFQIVTDHTEQALELLIEQYRGLPRLSGLIAAITNRIQELEDANWDVLNKRLLDYTDRNGNPAHAVAAQLDAVGRLVGQPRNGQDDATYLLYVRARIFLNKSRGRRGQIIQLIQLIEPALFTYDEFYPCTVLIQFMNGPSASPLVLTELARLAVPGGVRLQLVAPPIGANALAMFTCCSVGDASNPDQGFGHVGSTVIGGKLTSVYQ